MLSPDQVTACLVTRGDQPEMMERILDSLIFERVIVWDNSIQEDRKTAGRYMAAEAAPTDLAFFQDDDVIVPQETQRALLEAYESNVPTAVYGHGVTPAGYDDLPLVCGGAIMPIWMCWEAINRYGDHYPLDESFDYYCDFAIGVLYPRFKHVRLPFEIQMKIAQHPSRLCNQPFAAEMKHEVTRRAREIRDGVAE